MEAITVEFPLSGEWVAPNTPGHKVPSHGTDQLGQTYAYDFMQIDWKRPTGYKFFYDSMAFYFMAGVKLEHCYGWSKDILSPISGEVIECRDGWPERKRVNIVTDMLALLKNSLLINPRGNEGLRPALGNYMIIKGEEAYAFLAHARTGSISVEVGDIVKPLQKIAEVGHSGNSTAPHLHFHLMDNPNLLEAKGLPCCFREYEVFENKTWVKVANGIPGRRDRIRANIA